MRRMKLLLCISVLLAVGLGWVWHHRVAHREAMGQEVLRLAQQHLKDEQYKLLVTETWYAVLNSGKVTIERSMLVPLSAGWNASTPEWLAMQVKAGGMLSEIFSEARTPDEYKVAEALSRLNTSTEVFAEDTRRCVSKHVGCTSHKAGQEFDLARAEAKRLVEAMQ